MAREGGTGAGNSEEEEGVSGTEGKGRKEGGGREEGKGKGKDRERK